MYEAPKPSQILSTKTEGNKSKKEQIQKIERSTF